MPIVRASCASCGDVELVIQQVRVVVCQSTGDSNYAFQCPICRLIVSKPAEARVVGLLEAAGVSVLTWDLPQELGEINIGPPINHDDLLAFHFEIQSADWLDQLIAHCTDG